MHNAVCSREIGDEYLAFSGQSKETIILNYLAFEVLKALEKKSINFDDLFFEISKKNVGMTEQELSEFIKSTLEYYIEFGFVDVSDY